MLSDREELTRDLLMGAVKGLLTNTFFDVCVAWKIRAMALDLQGLPAESDEAMLALPVYKDLQRLHCVEYADLSASGRRAAIGTALDYAGLSEDAGPQLLGEQRWLAVIELVKARIEHQMIQASGSTAIHGREGVLEPDEWTLGVLTSSLLALLDADWFNICAFDRCGASLQILRAKLGMPNFDEAAISQLAGLRALHCAHFDKMDEVTKRGLPAAILSSLGLEDGQGAALLGTDGWAKLEAAYADPWPVPVVIDVDDEEPDNVVGPDTRRQVSLWARMFQQA